MGFLTKAKEYRMENYEILWNSALEVLKNTASSIAYSTYIQKITPVDLEGRKLVLNVPTELFAREIASRLLDKILAALKTAETGITAVKITVGDSTKDYLHKDDEEESILESSMEINPRYTFDSFVVGSSNKFLYSAAKAVAEDPGKNYNPLFIYGGTGLGKTHIMHAIANYVKKENPTANVFENKSAHIPSTFKAITPDMGINGLFMASVYSPKYTNPNEHPIDHLHSVLCDINFNVVFDPQPAYYNVKNYPYSKLIGYNGIRSIDIIRKL